MHIDSDDNGNESPSVWREWIEMQLKYIYSLSVKSPSVWREWIEICPK